MTNSATFLLLEKLLKEQKMIISEALINKTEQKKNDWSREKKTLGKNRFEMLTGW